MRDKDAIMKAANVKPSKRQLKWHKMEFYGFIHFSVNTFTGSEWGLGDEDPSIFDPSDFDADQWVETFKAAGMKGMILTCKHHDGFCLWPSRYTNHSVKASPWRNGEGDMVKEVSEACRRHGLKFGVYLSPWDRHEATYGYSPKYNEYFKNQLTELLTDYGDVFCIWFDGACGEGPNGEKQQYDWDGYYQIIRELQPEAVITICGPDVRWCGNEAGYCRESEWSVVPKMLQDCEKISENSQKADDGEFSRQINSTEDDLGSWDAIEGISDLVWYPAEVDTSIRPGWFYHESEDGQVKSLEELLALYYSTVGGNASLLLNVPPAKNGLIHPNDVKRLYELGTAIKETFSINLAEGAKAEASETSDDAHDVNCILNPLEDSFWSPYPGTESAFILIDLTANKKFDRIVLMEHIESGQRIEAFELEYMDDGDWTKFYSGTVIGYKHIACFEAIETRHIRLRIDKSRWCPAVKSFEVYKSSL